MFAHYKIQFKLSSLPQYFPYTVIFYPATAWELILSNPALKVSGTGQLTLLWLRQPLRILGVRFGQLGWVGLVSTKRCKIISVTLGFQKGKLHGTTSHLTFSANIPAQTELKSTTVCCGFLQSTSNAKKRSNISCLPPRRLPPLSFPSSCTAPDPTLDQCRVSFHIPLAQAHPRVDKLFSLVSPSLCLCSPESQKACA